MVSIFLNRKHSYYTVEYQMSNGLWLQSLVFLLLFTAYSFTSSKHLSQSHQSLQVTVADSLHCYISNCGSCKQNPLICENCLDLTACCSLHCKNCDGQVCSQCLPGYLLAINLCIPIDACSDIAGLCKNCTNDGICSACDEGFYLNSDINQCGLCPDECSSCFSLSNCTSCAQGYYIDGVSCLACDSTCLDCDDSSQCTACFNESNLFEGQCISCSSNCKNCLITSKTVSSCTQCNKGFLITSTSQSIVCLACPPNCSICTAQTNCQQCSLPGMFFNTTSIACQICVTSCSVCANGSVCQSCLSNFYINPIFGPKRCVTCLTSNCMLCKSSSICSICEPGYSLLQGYCIFCAEYVPNCFSCEINSSAVEASCLTCSSGYFLQGDQCQHCPAFCLSCYNSSFCTLCQAGFRTNLTTGECIAAYPQCNYLPGATTCQSCPSGYILGINACYPCQTLHCAFCSSTGSGQNNTCSICYPGYYLSDQMCLPCQGGCLVCSNAETCVSCEDGYYLNQISICQPCLNICYRCQLSKITGNIDCLQCRSGSYLGYIENLYAQTCILCNIEGCQICAPLTDGTIICLVCQKYQSFVSGFCTECSLNCLSCTNSDECVLCSPYYGLVNSYCIQCSLNCQNCVSFFSCTSCATFYYLNQTTGFCLSCSSLIVNCSICTSSACIICDNKSFLAELTSCLSCPDNCFSCSSATQCNTCDFGFYLTETRMCQKCNNLCLNCLSEMVCTGCLKGNYLSLSTGKCLICPIGCTTCSNQTNCMACLSNYEYDSGRCFERSSGLRWWGILLIAVGSVILIIIFFFLLRGCPGASNFDSSSVNEQLQLSSDSSHPRQ